MFYVNGQVHVKQFQKTFLALLLLKPVVMQNHQNIDVLGKLQHVLIKHTHAQISQQVMIVQDQLTVTGINQENVIHLHHVVIMIHSIVADIMDAKLFQVHVPHLNALNSEWKAIVMVMRLKLIVVHGQLMANANHYPIQLHAQTLVTLKTGAKAKIVNMQQIHVPLRHVQTKLVKVHVKMLDPVQLKKHYVLGVEQPVLMQLIQVN